MVNKCIFVHVNMTVIKEVTKTKTRLGLLRMCFLSHPATPIASYQLYT